MLVDIKLYVYCNSQQKEKKYKIEIFHINFENIFSPNIFNKRTLQSLRSLRHNLPATSQCFIYVKVVPEEQQHKYQYHSYSATIWCLLCTDCTCSLTAQMPRPHSFIYQLVPPVYMLHLKCNSTNAKNTIIQLTAGASLCTGCTCSVTAQIPRPQSSSCQLVPPPRNPVPVLQPFKKEDR